MVARSALGGAIAASAGASTLPHWVALALGAGMGILVPLVQYIVDHVLRLDDATSAIATHGLPALGGLLVTGVVDLPAQLRAQATGTAAIALSAFVLSWLLFATVQAFTRAWRGEFQIRLPRRKRPRTALAAVRSWPAQVRSWVATRRAARVAAARTKDEPSELGAPDSDAEATDATQADEADEPVLVADAPPDPAG
jgi:hypothetical protein